MWIRKLNSKAVEAPIKRVKRNLAILANRHKTITWFYFIFKSRWKYKSELNDYIKGLWKIVENDTHIFRVCVCFCSCFHWAGLRLSFQSVTASLGLFHLLLLLSSLSSSSLHFLLKNLNITGRGAEACARLSVVDMVVRVCVREWESILMSRSWKAC